MPNRQFVGRFRRGPNRGRSDLQPEPARILTFLDYIDHIGAIEAVAHDGAEGDEPSVAANTTRAPYQYVWK